MPRRCTGGSAAGPRLRSSRQRVASSRSPSEPPAHGCARSAGSSSPGNGIVRARKRPGPPHREPSRAGGPRTSGSLTSTGGPPWDARGTTTGTADARSPLSADPWRSQPTPRCRRWPIRRRREGSHAAWCSPRLRLGPRCSCIRERTTLGSRRWPDSLPKRRRRHGRISGNTNHGGRKSGSGGPPSRRGPRPPAYPGVEARGLCC